MTLAHGSAVLGAELLKYFEKTQITRLSFKLPVIFSTEGGGTSGSFLPWELSEMLLGRASSPVRPGHLLWGLRTGGTHLGGLAHRAPGSPMLLRRRPGVPPVMTPLHPTTGWGCAGAGEEAEVQDPFWGPPIVSVPGAWLPMPASGAWHRVGGRREKRGSVKELCFVGDAALVGFHPGSAVKRQLLPFEMALGS